MRKHLGLKKCVSVNRKKKERKRTARNYWKYFQFWFGRTNDKFHSPRPGTKFYNQIMTENRFSQGRFQRRSLWFFLNICKLWIFDHLVEERNKFVCEWLFLLLRSRKCRPLQNGNQYHIRMKRIQNYWNIDK